MEIRGTKIRLTILCARNLAKRDLFRLPDPFARVDVDATGVTHVSEAAKNTTDPKWNTHYDLHLSPNESFTLSVWNDKKMHKKTYNSGFLGCVRLMGNAIQRIKDTGYQRLDLVSDTKIGLPVKGQIVISLLSRDGHGTGSLNAVVDTLGNLTCSNDLPEGWEERRTPSGRVYYVNHVRRTTQWARPTEPASCGTTRRGDRGGTLSITNSSKNNNLSKTTTTTTTSSTPTSEGANSLPIASSHALTGNGTDNLPAVNNQDSPSSLSDPFSSLQPRRHQITQPDNLPPGYIMKTTEHGQIYYIHEGTGQTTWHDPRLTRALTSNEELNLGPLPPGWEQRVTDSSRPYFVNHNNHTTQFSDPRIPLMNDANNHHHDDNSPTNPSRGTSKNESATNVLPTNPSLSPETNDTHSNVRNSEPADSPSTSNEAPLSGTCSSSGSTSTTTSSTPSSLAPSNITNTTVSNVRATTSNNTVLRPRGEVIQQLSPFPVLPVSSSSSIISSPPPPPQTTSSSSSSVPNTPPVIGGPRCWPQDPLSIALHGGGTEFLPKFKKDLVAKIKVLRSELNNLQPQNGYCPLEVSRQEVFEDSYRQIVKMRYKVMRKKLRVKFRNEEGLDYGGVAREWLYLLSHEMLNPYYGLFQYSSEDVYTLQINPDSAVNPDHLSYFHFVGRIIGMAVFHGHFIDGCFTTPFYKMMLNKPINLDDIEAVDPDLHKSLKWILSNDISGIIDNTFSVEHEAFGLTKVYELKENGKDIPVNESNKVEYVKLYVQFRWCLGIEQQFLSLQKGFNELIPQNLLKPFDEKELELVIGGIGTIDIVDWKNHTRLKQCDAETPVVQWFWAIVDSYSSEMRARLLQFVTGSSRVPLQGFKDLQGSTGQTGPRHFTLHLTNAPVDSLPKARTCFNRLDLPAYPSFEIMAEKLTQAVEETCGFAVE